MGGNLLAFWGDGYGSSRFSFDSEGKRNGAKIAVEFDPAWYARTRTAIAVDRLPHVWRRVDFAYLGESYFMPHEFLKQIKGVEVRRPVLDFDAAARKLQHTVFCVDDVPLAFTLKRSRFTRPIAMKK